MANDMTARDKFVVECEPYFLDGAHTVAQFAQRTQEIIRRTVEERLGSIVKALGFVKDEVALLDYCYPDKLQRAEPMDDIQLGVKLKVSDQFEAAIYRYWTVEERTTGFAVYTWIKGRPKLDQLCKAIDDIPDSPPGPEEAWDFSMSTMGTYFITRSLSEADLSEPRPRLDELIEYYVTLIRKVRGAKRFLA